MDKGLSPSNIRITNKILITELLIVEPMSFTDLAKKLNLSKTAVKNICTELIEQKLIHPVSVKKVDTAGRRATLFDINANYGFNILILFNNDEQHDYFSVLACNLKGKVLTKKTFPPILGDTKKLEGFIISSINEILTAPEFKSKRLLNISIAAPGMIDDETGLLISTCLKRGDTTNYNLRELLEKTFNVPVHIRGAHNCEAKAELISGTFGQRCKFAIYFHLSDSIGMSFLIDNKVFSGAHGYAGEVSYLKTSLIDGYYDDLHDRTESSLSTDISLKRLRINISKKLNKSNSITQIMPLSKIIELLKKKDRYVMEELGMNAHKVAAFLKNLSLLLDPGFIVISGDAVKLGDYYLNIIKTTFTEGCTSRTKIQYSSLTDATFIGLSDTAITAAVKDAILKTD